MKKRGERRQLQYVQGSLAVKEQYLPKKRVEKKKIEKKQEQRKKRAASGMERRVLQERAKILREREKNHILQQERLKEKTSANLFLVFCVTAMMFVMGGLCFHYIQLQTEVNTRIRKIEVEKTRLDKLRQKNDALQNAINTSVNPEEVYEIATKELGMVYPGENQVIEYKKSESEYVRQYENIPKLNREEDGRRKFCRFICKKN